MCFVHQHGARLGKDLLEIADAVLEAGWNRMLSSPETEASPTVAGDVDGQIVR